jgi:hypothetical protein
MADIAILVAEEYERRVKNGRKAGGGGAEGEYCEIAHLLSYASTFARSHKMKKMELAAKWVREPKTQIGLAASNGFFSA